MNKEKLAKTLEEAWEWVLYNREDVVGEPEVWEVIAERVLDNREPVAWAVEEKQPNMGWNICGFFVTQNAAHRYENHLINEIGVPKKRVRTVPLYHSIKSESTKENKR